jgi:hypothetical protein
MAARRAEARARPALSRCKGPARTRIHAALTLLFESTAILIVEGIRTGEEPGKRMDPR